ncbi:MAG: hypothetical protein Q9188_007081, partial [Gyalolechia gomerana]
AHVCVSSTARIGAELGYEPSVVSDAIGDRDIPGASAQQLVDVGFSMGFLTLRILTGLDCSGGVGRRTRDDYQEW